MERTISFTHDVSVSDVLSGVTSKEAYDHFGYKALVEHMDIGERCDGYTLEEIVDNLFSDEELLALVTRKSLYVPV